MRRGDGVSSVRGMFSSSDNLLPGILRALLFGSPEATLRVVPAQIAPMCISQRLLPRSRRRLRGQSLLHVCVATAPMPYALHSISADTPTGSSRGLRDYAGHDVAPSLRVVHAFCIRACAAAMQPWRTPRPVVISGPRGYHGYA